VPVTVAQADAAASALHDQLTLVRAGDEPRDADRQFLRHRRHEMHTGAFLDDREAWAISDDPHDRSEAFTAATTSSAHRRAASETLLVPPSQVALLAELQQEWQPELRAESLAP